MDYRKTAKEILNHVGGSKNIVSAAHCATRLRLVIADNSKADKTALENADGVKGVFEASGQLQIILGTGTVNKVFDEFIAIAGITASTKAEAKEAAAEKQNWFMKAIKLLGDIFVPIIPAIVASGFLMGIMNALDFMNSNGFLHITKKVSDGAKVHAGDVLIKADLNAIKEAGHPATTMMILTNTDLYDSVECAAPGTVTGKSSVMKLTK